MGLVPVPGVVALVGALHAKWGQRAGTWQKGGVTSSRSTSCSLPRACLEPGAAVFCSLAALPVPQNPAPSCKRDRGGMGVIQGTLIHKPWCFWYYGMCVGFDLVCVGFNEEAD